MKLQLPAGAIYDRQGNFAIFDQLGVKLQLDSVVEDHTYYNWLDTMIGVIGALVPGAEIAEKDYARTNPRLNTGVYYDTDDRRLLGIGAVLRTTCNKKTHAFCAFKEPEDEGGVRRDHRYIFEGEEKSTIQEDPTSQEAITIVSRLLARTDIEHPGTYLLRHYGIRAEELTPSLCIEQYRHPFFVWLDRRDALRCSMDRAYSYNLRLPSRQAQKELFSEIELPVYPHIDSDVARDPRVLDLIQALSDSLCQEFGAQFTSDNKYQRAAKTLGITEV